MVMFPLLTSCLDPAEMAGAGCVQPQSSDQPPSPELSGGFGALLDVMAVAAVPVPPVASLIAPHAALPSAPVFAPAPLEGAPLADDAEPPVEERVPPGEAMLALLALAPLPTPLLAQMPVPLPPKTVEGQAPTALPAALIALPAPVAIRAGAVAAPSPPQAQRQAGVAVLPQLAERAGSAEAMPPKRLALADKTPPAAVKLTRDVPRAARVEPQPAVDLPATSGAEAPPPAAPPSAAVPPGSAFALPLMVAPPLATAPVAAARHIAVQLAPMMPALAATGQAQQLRLHPEHLGQVEISWTAGGGGRELVIAAQDAGTQALLTRLAPRLRDQLAILSGASDLRLSILSEVAPSARGPAETAFARAENAPAAAALPRAHAEAGAGSGHPTPQHHAPAYVPRAQAGAGFAVNHEEPSDAPAGAHPRGTQRRGRLA